MAQELQKALVKRLNVAKENPSSLFEIKIKNSTYEAQTMGDLCKNSSFEIFEDDDRYNLYPKFMIDVIHGMSPDIVIRAQQSNENRIYIEVKENNADNLHHDKHSSQIIRYFLHLLATSTRRDGSGIHRAVLLAAPDSWFSVGKNIERWDHFIRCYSDLARDFGITFGEIRGETILIS